MRNRYRFICLAGVATGLVGGTPAFAQLTPDKAPSTTPVASPSTTPAATPDNSVDPRDIVVTARRREERAQNIPIPITALSGEELQQTKAFSLESLAPRVPNVNIFKQTGSNNTFGVYVRGIGRDNPFPVVEAPVATYINDVFYPYSFGQILGLDDIDRIEVLRGPQGTLYGRNATVGAVKIYTQRPNLTDSNGQGRLTIGSYGRTEVTASVSAPVIKDQLAIKVSAGYQGYDGYIYDRVEKRYVNGGKTLSARASLLWKPSSATEVYLIADYMNQDNDPYLPTSYVVNATNNGATPRFTSSPYITEHLGPNLNKLNTGSVSLQITQDLGAVTFKSISSYRASNLDYAIDNFARRDVPFWSGLIDGTKDKTFTQELQVNGELFDKRLSYTVGAFYLNSDLELDLSIPNIPSPQFYFNHQKTQSFAAYADVTFAITPRLNLGTGVRYTSDHKKVNQIKVATPGSFNVNGSDSWQSVTPRVSLDFKVADNVLAYVSFSKGFKGGSLTSPTPSIAAAAGVFAPPETDRGYEVGLKTQWFDNRVTFNVDYYNTFITNQTTAAINAVGTVDLIFNDALTKGWEFEFNARPVKGLSFFAALGLSDAQFKNLPAGHPALTFPDRRLKLAPKYTLNLGGEYEADLGSGSARIGADYTRVDSIYVNLTRNFISYQPAYDIVNAHVGYKFAGNRIELLFSGTNLTNTQYFKAAAVAGPARYYEAPREFMGTVKLHW